MAQKPTQESETASQQKGVMREMMSKTIGTQNTTHNANNTQGRTAEDVNLGADSLSGRTGDTGETLEADQTVERAETLNQRLKK